MDKNHAAFECGVGVHCRGFSTKSITAWSTLKPMAPTAWAKCSLSPVMLATINLSSAAATQALGAWGQNSLS